MARVLLEGNFDFVPSTMPGDIVHGRMSFSPMFIGGTISLAYANIAHRISLTASADMSYTVSLGLYSMNAGTLSLHQSVSASRSDATAAGTRASHLYMTFSYGTTNDITPGSWWWGVLVSMTGAAAGSQSIRIYGGTVSAQNSFPGAFYAGAMTETTNALPTSYDTASLDGTGAEALSQYILISA